MQLYIKITGNGTREEIYESLRNIADQLVESSSGTLADGFESEDPTLFCEVEEYDPSDDDEENYTTLYEDEIN